ncbi:hypothetical protein Pmar_PMAR023566 [Perkinsus marinus ATCC 50983]|uniref:SWIM-type domain-containing protein n=1 Tax=Perkinsus marinus (strain ATCC 50983 / TXsc) TaxID=423536 RepID=C5KCP6_PERM5|nr:hypothetical protein Pmar_PMAR023566 [Perkinsus marinus ATCC 50983]EER17645.1 hypothetical protein Pmar_PMAR023566 [Perkinsus marinus ATCC 50983]|eukprot:XP_002785849.1 hypothetical protein Pmar_PMAR023566 [Perkinsus marinus ATCC 50983]
MLLSHRLLPPQTSTKLQYASLWHVLKRCYSNRPWTKEEDAGLSRICGDVIKALPAWVATTSVTQLLDRALKRALRQRQEDGVAVFEGRDVNEMLVRLRDLGLENREVDRRWLTLLKRRMSQLSRETPPNGEYDPEYVATTILAPVGKKTSSELPSLSPVAFTYFLQICSLQPRISRIMMDYVIQHLSLSEASFGGDVRAAAFYHNQAVAIIRQQANAIADSYVNFKRELKINVVLRDVLSSTSEVRFLLDIGQGKYSSSHYLDDSRMWNYARGDVFLIGRSHPDQLTTLDFLGSCAKVYNDSRYFAYPRLRISADTPLAKQTITVNCAACEQSELRVSAESHLEGRTELRCKCHSFGRRPRAQQPVQFPTDELWLGKLTRVSRNGNLGEIRLKVFPASPEALTEVLGSQDQHNERTKSASTAITAFTVAIDNGQIDWLCVPVTANIPQVSSRELSAVFAVSSNDMASVQPTPVDLEGLTESQKSAVRAAVSSRLTLIQGPPGTGKTFVVVAIVKHWLKTNPEFPILVCAGTHAARALLHAQLEAQGISVTPPPVYSGIEEENNRGAEQVILLGDDRQLSSVSGGLSLFDELLDSNLGPPKLLREQFRMHPEVAAFSSQHFYDHQLTSHPSWKSKFWPPLMLPHIFADRVVSVHGSRVVFVDTGGATREAFDKGCDSYYNVQEADAVIQTVDSLLATGADDSDIGVVTPYAAQRTYLRRQLHLIPTNIVDGAYADSDHRKCRELGPNTSIPDPIVDSVDAFQGSERSWIVFSAVRSNPEYSVGFLNDYRRVNVMLTRARYGVIVVGDRSTLQVSEPWRAWLSWVYDNGTVVRLDKESLSRIAATRMPNARRIRFAMDRWDLGISMEAAYGKVQNLRPLAEACVWAATSEYNTVEVQLEERTGNVIHCLCTCSDARRHHGRCAHAAALVIRVRQVALGMTRQYSQSQFLLQREAPMSIGIQTHSYVH